MIGQAVTVIVTYSMGSFRLDSRIEAGARSTLVSWSRCNEGMVIVWDLHQPRDIRNGLLTLSDLDILRRALVQPLCQLAQTRSWEAVRRGGESEK